MLPGRVGGTGLSATSSIISEGYNKRQMQHVSQTNMTKNMCVFHVCVLYTAVLQ